MPVQIKGVGSISGLDQGIVVGIATATNFKTGSSNLHSTGLTVGNNFLHSTGINVGTGATIHVPATNTLTFGTNSNERARIDSSGRVLIGTTTEGSSASDDLTIATSGTTGITIRSGTSNNGNIEFSDGTSGQDEYRGIVQYAHSDDSMRFYTNATEKVRITSAGDVGIGTAIPVVANNYGNLSLAGGTGGQLELKRVSDDIRHYIWGNQDLNIGGGYHNGSSSSIIFRVNGATERLRINSSGQVGIGTDSPTHKLQIQDSGAYFRLLNGHESDYDLRFMTQNGEANIWHYGTDDFVIGTRYDRKFHLQQNAGKRLTIMGNGKIGINSTTPVRTMDIRPEAGATNSNLALTASADSGSFSQLIFARPGDGYRGGVYYDHSQDQMKLYGGSQQIEIAELGGPQGYMGVGNDIGNSSNDGSWDARFNVYGANHAKMEIHQNYDDVRSHWWVHSGHAQAYIGTRSNHDFVFHTNNNVRGRFNNQGGFRLFDGVYNYIESAEYRIYSNSSINDGYTGAIRTVARYNTNTSLFSHTETGGTGGASRWTFGKNCYCLLTVSQDVKGNTDTNYWWMGPKINNNFIGRHLIRKTSEWDMFTFQQSFQVSANDYLEIAWGNTANLTAVDGTDWSHYSFIIWENK